MAYSQEEYEFWQWLYEYNQQQPQKHKLHVLGLDIEFQPNSSARGLSLLLDESVTPAQEIRPLIEKLKASDGEALGKLPKAMEQYPQEMQEAFGENFAWAQQYAKNITATYIFYQVRKETEDEEQAHRVREKSSALQSSSCRSRQNFSGSLAMRTSCKKIPQVLGSVWATIVLQHSYRRKILR